MIEKLIKPLDQDFNFYFITSNVFTCIEPETGDIIGTAILVFGARGDEGPGPRKIEKAMQDILHYNNYVPKKVLMKLI